MQIFISYDFDGLAIFTPP